LNCFYPSQAIHFKCDFEKIIFSFFSYPAASLTWFLNTEKARESMVTSYMAKVGDGH
jgi:hypothetical protein